MKMNDISVFKWRSNLKPSFQSSGSSTSHTAQSAVCCIKFLTKGLPHLIGLCFTISLFSCLAMDVATIPNRQYVFEDTVYFEIDWPETLRYTYKLSLASSFGSAFDKMYSNVELILADPEDGCQDLYNEVRGAVALIVRGLMMSERYSRSCPGQDIIAGQRACAQSVKAIVIYYGSTTLTTTTSIAAAAVKTSYDILSCPNVAAWGCSFLTKSKIAQRAGAIAAIIMDNEENQIDRMIDMADDHTGRSVEIPSAFLTGKDGEMIRRYLNAARTDRAIINIPVNLTGKALSATKRPPWTVW